jgi:hypothetical protein
MRFPYLELHANAEKYIERKVTTAAPSPTVVKPTAQAGNVPVAPQPEVVQVAPPKKPPVVVSEQVKPPSQVNEQQHFFE